MAPRFSGLGIAGRLTSGIKSAKLASKAIGLRRDGNERGRDEPYLQSCTYWQTRAPRSMARVFVEGCDTAGGGGRVVAPAVYTKDIHYPWWRSDMPRI